MGTVNKVIGYLVVMVHSLLLFLLAFEHWVEVPAWLQTVGRAHPLLLHLPIGFLLVVALLVFMPAFRSDTRFRDTVILLLHLTAFVAGVSALFGLILSLEDGYASDTLTIHKWSGVALSLFCWMMLALTQRAVLLRMTVVFGVGILVVTGHFGATITHGENFLLAPLQTGTDDPLLTDNATLFEAGIAPIFEKKCSGCHNAERAKGRLILTSMEGIRKGGKTGPLWQHGATQSLLLERLALPLDHKKHMPPKEKAQLTKDELLLIEQWVTFGADFNTTLAEIKSNDSLNTLVRSVIARYSGTTEKSNYTFEFASWDVVRQLNMPYRRVAPLAQEEPALEVDFFLPGSFKQDFLRELLPVKEQVVSLNLSGMPIADSTLSVLREFVNLEEVNLNYTPVTGGSMIHLATLPNLRALSLAGTALDANALSKVAANSSLARVVVWNTPVSEDDVVALEKTHPHITWERGYRPDSSEVLRLSPPYLVNDDQLIDEGETIHLRHRLPGTSIRFTTDGTAPDSLGSPEFEKPFTIDHYTVLKTLSVKEGWLSSHPEEYVLFRKGYRPDRVKMLTNADERYPGDGAEMLIDNVKGMPDYYRDKCWMGFRQNPLEAVFHFDTVEPPLVSRVTLSYARNVYALCMPPASIEIWGGDDSGKLTLLKKVIPSQPDNYVSVRIEGASVEIPPSRYSVYKLVAKPLPVLPAFTGMPGEKGWLMVDEVFFN